MNQSVAGNITYFTKSEYQKLRDHARCWCGHNRKNHDDRQCCVQCNCKQYGRRVGGRPKITPVQRDDSDADFFEQEGEAGQEWHMCMWFYDTTDAPHSCNEEGKNVGTIEIPLGVVDVMWRRDLRTALTYQNAHVRPAEHPLSRGCYITMPLVLCPTHIAQMAIESAEHASRKVV